MKGTVLIVEDQPNFREGLKFMISQSRNWTVIGEADTGEEGWQKALELRPDLILMDIHMPVMNGIELAERIHSHGMDTLFIIITGYQDFQYAQSAIRYGAMDFLLKPCSDDDISGILGSASKKLQAKRKEQQTTREHLLRSILLKYQMNQELTSHFLRMFEGSRLWLVTITDYFPEGKNYGSDDLYVLQYGIYNIVQELALSEDADAKLLILKEDQFVLSVSSELATACWRENAELAVREYLGIEIENIPLGPSSDVNQLMSAYAAYNEQRVQPALAPQSVHRTGRHQAIEAVKNKIMALIISGDFQALHDYFEKVGRHACSLQLTDGKILAINHSLALGQISEVLGLFSHQRKPAEALLQTIDQLPGSKELQSWFKEACQDFETRLDRWKQQANPYVNSIQQAIDYIEEHYLDSDLSIKQVAENIHLNPSYLSTLFKKETGETFTGYVTKLKLQKAQVLLRNTEMKISEICQTVGFEDSTYFSSVFKKHFQISPSEFRQNH
ncbi:MULTISPECIES: response regulator [unclassified Paenibacillus]|uniref:response regulator n=1 Tax=unclassified Paenibacillus TaxID=185978 RepID=UPI00104ECFE9|nr:MULTISPECIES: response regulator [unclassified Paenibacillus]NIK69101.1 two-component system response regulator YesN [Paenibacillus sp. BK720]TCM89104.1 two-component system response regulator YesN [Paenibacillus sp. BK033]